MPSKNVIRNFTENGHYHIFNRGVEKRRIFINTQDYKIFLYYLFIYLMPLEQVLLKYPNLPIRLYSKNLNKEVELLTYCIMPNHFHLLLKQNTIDGISRLIKQLTNAYTFYFNNKYKRVGGLMQGRYKAVLIDNDKYLTHISRYIHLNPLIGNLTKDLKEYKWSSFPMFLNRIEGSICNKIPVLSFFSTPYEYERFILDHGDYARELDLIKHLTLE